MIKNGKGETMCAGMVIAVREYQRHVHSDNAMIDSGDMLEVIVSLNGGYEKLTYDNGRSDSYVTATVDAPAEVLAQYAKDLATVAELDAEVRYFEALERERLTVSKGKTITVFKGRKVPVGTTGLCIWVGHGTYGERVGIKDANGTVHWTAKDNVRVA